MVDTLGCTVLHRTDWLEVMRHADYTGDYRFTDSKTLKLTEAIKIKFYLTDN